MLSRLRWAPLPCLAFLACNPNADGALPQGAGTGGSDLSIPCVVEKVLEQKCWSCHGEDTQFGAPVSLVSYDDLHAPAFGPEYGGAPLFQIAAQKLDDPSKPMPPPSMPQLTPDERALLKEWANQKAPPDRSCAELGGAGGASGGGGGAVGGGGAGTGGFTGAVEDIPVPPEPGECETIDIRARADASGAPYIVPANAFELYQMFEFEIPLGGTAQALSFEPLIDNTKVIHHWLLYQSNGVVVNGRNYTALGVHGDSFLVAGWAPGTGPWYLPKHVGVDLGAGKFILEVHYNNPGGGPEPDSSGVRVCKTNNLRPQTASVSWLGNDLFGINPLSTVEVAGRCRPVNQTEPIHILRTWPHMHLMGRRMRVVIDRAGGGQDVVHDQPFDFNNQIQYDTPTILNPGDSILTTCYFDNTSPNFITFGEATTQEMCFNFTVAYPANKLVQQTLHNNSCISLP